jgi:hypothetical protein
MTPKVTNSRKDSAELCVAVGSAFSAVKCIPPPNPVFTNRLFSNGVHDYYAITPQFRRGTREVLIPYSIPLIPIKLSFSAFYIKILIFAKV